MGNRLNHLGLCLLVAAIVVFGVARGMQVVHDQRHERKGFTSADYKLSQAPDDAQQPEISMSDEQPNVTLKNHDGNENTGP